MSSYLQGGGKVVDVSRRRFTGAGLPAWKFLIKGRLLMTTFAEPFPAQYPYTGPDDFKRLDEADDTEFYKYPRLVYHIDEGAVASLTHHYARTIKPGSDTRHLQLMGVALSRDFPEKMHSIVGTGISAPELRCNDQLSKSVASDLNKSPKLPFADKSFDYVTCVVSFDYLTHPLEVMKEVVRVLRPAAASFSRRAIAASTPKQWVSGRVTCPIRRTCACSRPTCISRADSAHLRSSTSQRQGRGRTIPCTSSRRSRADEVGLRAQACAALGRALCGPPPRRPTRHAGGALHEHTTPGIPIPRRGGAALGEREGVWSVDGRDVPWARVFTARRF